MTRFSCPGLPRIGDYRPLSIECRSHAVGDIAIASAPAGLTTPTCPICTSKLGGWRGRGRQRGSQSSWSWLTGACRSPQRYGGDSGVWPGSISSWPPHCCPGSCTCLLYTSDAADDLTRVDLGGRRIIKKKKK